MEFVLHLFEPPPPAHPLSNSSVFIVFFVSGGTLLSLRGGLGKTRPRAEADANEN